MSEGVMDPSRLVLSTADNAVRVLASDIELLNFGSKLSIRWSSVATKNCCHDSPISQHLQRLLANKH